MRDGTGRAEKRDGDGDDGDADGGGDGIDDDIDVDEGAVWSKLIPLHRQIGQILVFCPKISSSQVCRLVSRNRRSDRRC